MVAEEMSRNVSHINSKATETLENTLETKDAAHQIGVMSHAMQDLVSKFKV